ncbi:hypothetical protein F2Q69_00024317 [Brassica cretica]|uniref:Uncharacterized protein n=1 Tax=Brassica cretica TaxID=69181 RepID=A0A8S9QCA8_BRACR|nr:hypothetical protein F2Q69_00024317 [Brassica cretica]
MGDHCMVIAGEWTSGDSRWNFAIDKEIMSRIVPVFPGMPLIELQNNVVNEFFTVWLRHLRFSMGDHCMVIAGEWTFGDSRWNFAIDKEIMSRIVPVFPGMPLIELQNNVVNEFFTAAAPPVLLNYWSSNTRELATGLTTPPIILTTPPVKLSVDPQDWDLGRGEASSANEAQEEAWSSGQRCGEDRNVTVDNNSVVAMEEMLSLDYRVQVNGKGY